MIRCCLGLVLAGMALSPASASTAEDNLANVRAALAKGCNLATWQSALTLNDVDEVRVELSPTASPKQVQCTYQTLADFGVTLDRPAPVQVVRRRVERPVAAY